MRRMKYISRGMLAAALCMGLSFSAVGCSNTQANTEQEIPTLIEPKGVSIQTIRVERRDIVNAKYSTVQICPRSMKLCFEIDGEVAEVFVERGVFIKAGTLIAKLDEEVVLEKLEEMNEALEDFREQYDERIEDYNKRIADLNREIRELKSRINSSSGDTQKRLKADREIKMIALEKLNIEFENAKISLDERLAELQEAYDEEKSKIGHNCLYAEEDGYVSTDLVGLIGKKVKAEDEVVTMLNDDELYIYDLYMAEKYFDQLAEHYVLVNGEKIELTYVELTEEELKRVSATQTPGANIDRNIRYRVAVAPGQKVHVGDTAIKVTVSDYREQVPVLPLGVIQKDKLGSYVYQVKDGVRSRVEVIPGKQDNCFVEILSGLQEGDEVYVQY